MGEPNLRSPYAVADFRAAFHRNNAFPLHRREVAGHVLENGLRHPARCIAFAAFKRVVGNLREDVSAQLLAVSADNEFSQ